MESLQTRLGCHCAREHASTYKHVRYTHERTIRACKVSFSSHRRCEIKFFNSFDFLNFLTERDLVKGLWSFLDSALYSVTLISSLSKYTWLSDLRKVFIWRHQVLKSWRLLSWTFNSIWNITYAQFSRRKTRPLFLSRYSSIERLRCIYLQASYISALGNIL